MKLYTRYGEGISAVRGLPAGGAPVSACGGAGRGVAGCVGPPCAGGTGCGVFTGGVYVAGGGGKSGFDGSANVGEAGNWLGRWGGVTTVAGPSASVSLQTGGLPTCPGGHTSSGGLEVDGVVVVDGVVGGVEGGVDGGVLFGGVLFGGVGVGVPPPEGGITGTPSSVRSIPLVAGGAFGASGGGGGVGAHQ